MKGWFKHESENIKGEICKKFEIDVTMFAKVCKLSGIIRIEILKYLIRFW